MYRIFLPLGSCMYLFCSFQSFPFSEGPIIFSCDELWLFKYDDTQVLWWLGTNAKSRRGSRAVTYLSVCTYPCTYRWIISSGYAEVCAVAQTERAPNYSPIQKRARDVHEVWRWSQELRGITFYAYFSHNIWFS